jgi:type IV pilus assembly protein PilB
MSQVPLTIEDLLIAQGTLTAAQVSQVKLENINSGKPIDQIILERKLVPEAAIIQAKAQLLGLPFITVSGRPISPEVLNLVPESAARRYNLIPFDKDLTSVSVAMFDPLDLQVIQFLERRTGLQVKRYLATSSDITKSIESQYSQNLTSVVTTALKEVSKDQPVPGESRQEESQIIEKDASVASIVTQLIEYAVQANASDIHIEPEEKQTRVRYRLDGILHEKIILPKALHDAVLSRVKILSGLKIDERRLPQDGRFTFNFGGKEVDLRVSTLPTVYGEKAVLRLLAKSTLAPTLPELGLHGVALKVLEAQMSRPHGIIIICGPTGSGKTTTLYSILSKLSTAKVNILTIEDPVEYQIPGANQVQANPAIGLTFASALRSFLRQDPNIMLVGEIRDTETAELAIQAALTGHQVFSTLHTNSAAGALPRLLDMGTEPFLVASSVNVAVGQRILRKICPHCQVSYNPPPEIVQNIQQVLGKMLPNKPIVLYKGNGCPSCGHTGYQGRTGIYEVLPVTEKITRLILERASTGDIEQQAVQEGMITLKQDGYFKALEGVTTMEEVLRVGQD